MALLGGMANQEEGLKAHPHSDTLLPKRPHLVVAGTSEAEGSQVQGLFGPHIEFETTSIGNLYFLKLQTNKSCWHSACMCLSDVHLDIRV